MEEYKEYINNLRESTMFHMSLGSKELFHSNFLHWISIVNWDAFLKIMHGLAGLNEGETFWWEDHKCSVEGYEEKYRPGNNNVKVFREHRNFDLSIYILDSETHKDETKNSNNNEKADNDNTQVYTYNSEGKRLVQRWIPVLVLENKMKSLPYVAQLEGYTPKAFEEWRKGEKLIKPEINELKSDSESEKTVSEEWIHKHGITFVLLSLMDTKIGNDDDYKIEQELSYKKKGEKKLKFPFIWRPATYCQLVEILDEIITNGSFSLNKELDRSVIKDYKDFVKAFCNLAEKWNVTPCMDYRSQIFPWNVNTPDAVAKRKEIDEYKELRIHDIHEKLLYNQLLQLLEDKLKQENLLFKRYNIKTFKEEINNKNCRIFTNSNYAHGVGIVEAFYVINEKFKLYIQVQGDRYCHMVIYEHIVSEGKDSEGKKTLSVNMGVVSEECKNCLNPISETLGSYISIDSSKPNFPWEEQLFWGRYGNDNIYQFVVIPETATILDVINAIVCDIKNIRNWYK